jgi:hypothetical protein
MIFLIKNKGANTSGIQCIEDPNILLKWLYGLFVTVYDHYGQLPRTQGNEDLQLVNALCLSKHLEVKE